MPHSDQGQIIRRHVNRSLRGLDRLELWLVSAVVSILCVRLFLELTGYPQVGGSKLHVAHVLWGGLLMAVGMIITFSLMGRFAEGLGVVAGGVGFGLFIDEVGKFVTKDNDYFYQPSVAIMYIVFVLLYMAVRWLLTSAGYSRTEYLVNALDEMRELPIGISTSEEKKRILYHISLSDTGDPLVASLREVMEGYNPQTARGAGRFVYWRDRFYGWYRALTANRWFTKILAGFFILQFIGTIAVGLTLLLDPGELLPQLEAFGFSDWAILASNAISAIYITWGVLLLRRTRLEAYNMFERSVLVQIFVGQMFLFYKDEFSAVPGFIFYLLLLLAIRFIIQREKSEIIGASLAS